MGDEHKCPHCRGTGEKTCSDGEVVDCPRCNGRGDLPVCPNEGCQEGLETDYGLNGDKQWTCTNCRTFIANELVD